MGKIFLSGLTLDEMAQLFTEWGFEPYRARQIMDAIYKEKMREVSHFRNLPKTLLSRLEETAMIQNLNVVEKALSHHDKSIKFLFRLGDGEYVEAVWMPQSVLRTVCLSTQVGCPLKCSFCASGQVKFKRNLLPHEIVGQMLAIQSILEKDEKPGHVVFMGMGEPLLNLDHVLKSIAILNAPWAFGIGSRRITISTAGCVPGILKFAKVSDEFRQVRLSISLHATRDDERNKIMPINQKYPVSQLIKAVQAYCEVTGRRVTFEYLLLKDLNDHKREARELAHLSRGVAHSINVIEYNEVEGTGLERSLRSNEFMDELKCLGVVATLRRSKGRDIEAACGQLRGTFIKKSTVDSPQTIDKKHY